jgi:hypothetical protein
MKGRVFVLLFLLCGQLHGQQQVQTPKAVQEIFAPSLVKVSCGPYGGSGTVINTDGTKYEGTTLVLTAWHVVESNPNDVAVEFQGSNQKYRVNVICRHERADCCLLQRADQPVDVPGCYLAPSQEGRLWYMGFSYRGPLAFVGRVVSTYDTWAEVTGSSIEGMSGTGVSNELGELVAVVYARNAAPPQLMIMTTNSAVRAMAYKHFGSVFAAPSRPRMDEAAIGTAQEPRPGPGWHEWTPMKVKQDKSADRVQFPDIMPVGREMPAVVGGPQRYGCPPGGNCPPRMIPIRPRPGTPQPALPSPPQIDLDDLAARIVKKIPKPKDGRDGKDGQDGAPGPAGPPGPEGKISDGQMLALVGKIQAAIKGDPEFKGAKGDKGDKGDPGKDAIVDYGKLAEYVKIPPRRVILVDGESGKVLGDEVYAPDEPIVIDFRKVIREANKR